MSCVCSSEVLTNICTSHVGRYVSRDMREVTLLQLFKLGTKTLLPIESWAVGREVGGFSKFLHRVSKQKCLSTPSWGVQCSSLASVLAVVTVLQTSPPWEHCECRRAGRGVSRCWVGPGL